MTLKLRLTIISLLSLSTVAHADDCKDQFRNDGAKLVVGAINLNFAADRSPDNLKVKKTRLKFTDIKQIERMEKTFFGEKEALTREEIFDLAKKQELEKLGEGQIFGIFTSERDLLTSYAYYSESEFIDIKRFVITDSWRGSGIVEYLVARDLADLALAHQRLGVRVDARKDDYATVAIFQRLGFKKFAENDGVISLVLRDEPRFPQVLGNGH